MANAKHVGAGMKARSAPVLLWGNAPLPEDLEEEGVLRADLEELIEGRLLVDADSGAGKTHMTFTLCEALAGTVPQIIVDPESEYAGLRRAGDYVLASAAPGEGDVLAHPSTAAALTRFLCERNLSAILDIFEMGDAEREVFVAAVARELRNMPQRLWRTPRLFLVDEGILFAPQDANPPCKKGSRHHFGNFVR